MELHKLKIQIEGLEIHITVEYCIMFNAYIEHDIQLSFLRLYFMGLQFSKIMFGQPGYSLVGGRGGQRHFHIKKGSQNA